MHIPSQDELIAQIEGFCARHDMSESRLGRDALNNPAFVGGLREGKSPTLETLNRVTAFMRDKDEHAALRAKLDAPLDVPSEGGAQEGDSELPFAQAPVNPTGASSPTSSPTSARPTSRAASGSCPSCSTEERL